MFGVTGEVEQTREPQEPFLDDRLTCDGVLNDRVLQVFAHPLLAAFPR